MTDGAALQPPMPPLDLRRSVGHEGTAEFENPHGKLAFGDDVPAGNYHSVLDFGCGCGRVARQMMLQADARPERYLGVDLYAPSIKWCQKHLSAWDPNYRFARMNAHNPKFNPRGRQAPIPTRETYSLVNAHSVFTHILERDIQFYFNECRRSLEPGGVLRATWFMFDKAEAPMMHDYQHALYISLDDPTHAVIYDRDFVRDLYRNAGLSIFRVHPPALRGFQWIVYGRLGPGKDVAFPRDEAPLGRAPPPR